MSATCGGVRVVCVYVPNGRDPDSDHYRYKLAWLESLREMLASGPEATVVCGDMNIAPTDEDVFNPTAYVGHTHVTPAERAALAELEALGLHDVVREHWPDERVFSYWDYRAGMFHQDLGMRIDLVLASGPVASRVRAAWVDRQARKGSGPSDHAPVIIDLDEAPDGDIGPVVPPPSAPASRDAMPKLPQTELTPGGGSNFRAARRAAIAGGRGRARAERASALPASWDSRADTASRRPHLRRRYICNSGSREWAVSSIRAWRSPTSANRAGMVATVKSSGATSGSSSQSTGAETGAPGFGRTL